MRDFDQRYSHEPISADFGGRDQDLSKATTTQINQAIKDIAKRRSWAIEIIQDGRPIGAREAIEAIRDEIDESIKYIRAIMAIHGGGIIEPHGNVAIEAIRNAGIAFCHNINIAANNDGSSRPA